MILNFPTNQKTILALGSEQDTRFVLCKNNQLFFSANSSATDFENLQIKIQAFLKQHSVDKPEIILSDLHPEYISTKTAEILAKEWQIPHFKIQHHYAHFFSAIMEYYFLGKQETKLPDEIIGIICDGTGYGLDDTIWGGEVIKIKIQNSKFKIIERIGHLEPQTLLGGELAINEPARMLMSILNKFLNQNELGKIISKFYDEKTFKLLSTQLNKNFNCQATSSCARILDASCALLFDHNRRDFKHQAVKILEQNSNTPYDNIAPIINKLPIYELQTTPLFKYLIANLDLDKKRLAGTVHRYLAEGLYQIANNYSKQTTKAPIFFSGGMANNKIFHKYFSDKNVIINKTIPSGDLGIGVGQIGYYLTQN